MGKLVQELEGKSMLEKFKQQESQYAWRGVMERGSLAE